MERTIKERSQRSRKRRLRLCPKYPNVCLAWLVQSRPGFRLDSEDGKHQLDVQNGRKADIRRLPFLLD
jgi:hypothetical protein